jgi:hypothetical protein
MAVLTVSDRDAARQYITVLRVERPLPGDI